MTEIERLKARIRDLERDQEDWRKGVALIASALGEEYPVIVKYPSPVPIFKAILEIRAQLEEATKA